MLGPKSPRDARAQARNAFSWMTKSSPGKRGRRYRECRETRTAQGPAQKDVKVGEYHGTRNSRGIKIKVEYGVNCFDYPVLSKGEL